jgi:hypothetical protein
VVRAVRPTGVFDDYEGIGFFADPSLPPEQKGIEVRAPAGEAKVMAVGGGTITLSAALPLQAGDTVFLGDEEAGALVDGEMAKALARARVGGAGRGAGGAALQSGGYRER